MGTEGIERSPIDPPLSWTPWGAPHDATEFGPGVTFYSTPSHGGFHLAPEQDRQVPSALKSDRYCPTDWYEEDCEWAVVAIIHHRLFREAELKAALQTYRQSFPDCWRQHLPADFPLEA